MRTAQSKWDTEYSDMIRICPFGVSEKTRKTYIVHIYQGKTVEHEIISVYLNFTLITGVHFHWFAVKK